MTRQQRRARLRSMAKLRRTLFKIEAAQAIGKIKPADASRMRTEATDLYRVARHV